MDVCLIKADGAEPQSNRQKSQAEHDPENCLIESNSRRVDSNSYVEVRSYCEGEEDEVDDDISEEVPQNASEPLPKVEAGIPPIPGIDNVTPVDLSNRDQGRRFDVRGCLLEVLMSEIAEWNLLQCIGGVSDGG